MEYLDIVDENNNVTGKKEERQTIHENGLWHREVCIWIYHKQKGILLQKRAITKRNAPGKWEICAGHVLAGEEPINSAIREIQEEIGITVVPEQLDFITVDKLQKQYKDRQNNDFSYRYGLELDDKNEKFKLQKEEVSDVQYVTIEELEKIVMDKNDEYVFSKRSYMKEVLEYLKEKMK